MIQGPQSGNSSQQSQANTKDKPADKAAEQDADDFSKAMDDKKKKKTDKKDLRPEDLFAGKKKDSEGVAGEVAGKNSSTQLNKVSDVQGVNSKDAIDKIDKIAEKIMISSAGDAKAVKVKFNDSLLPGTEVTIRKDGAQMKIEFTTTSAESFNLLSKGEQALVDALNKKTGNDVTVEINTPEGDMDQDSGDGRSRNEFMAEDSEDKKESDK